MRTLIAVATALPLTPLDVVFARTLMRTARRVAGQACGDCSRTYGCDTCACPQGPDCGELLCDICTSQVCGCYCPPPPIC